MRGRRLRRLGCIAAGCATAVLATLAFDWVRWRERPDSRTGVALELSPARQVIRTGQVPRLAVTLINRGAGEVVLVEPGDGSDCGWRTPAIEWSSPQRWPAGRCRNVNALKVQEVFTLRRGRRVSSIPGSACPTCPAQARIK
jgi:hypothetical protein